jgi:hypothetical protein
MLYRDGALEQRVMKRNGIIVLALIASLRPEPTEAGARQQIDAGITAGQTREQSAAPELSALEKLGQAYATAWGLTLSKVETSIVKALSSGNASEIDELQKSLAVGYAPEPGKFVAVPLSMLRDVMKIQMAGGRTPAEVVRAVAAPGNQIVRVAWYFGTGNPSISNAVFSADGKNIVFDTLIFLPVLQGPVLEQFKQ